VTKRFGDKPTYTAATVLRLCEPWFASGRTVVADSWFGSTALATSLYQRGLFSILQVKKRQYWPKNIPGEAANELSDVYGSTQFRVTNYEGIRMFFAALRDRKPVYLLATCSTTAPGQEVTHVIKDKKGRSSDVTFVRPVVFDDYSKGRNAVDAANNLRDNMTSYHDVLRGDSWLHRVFAFYLGVVEANAYAAHRKYNARAESVQHAQFRQEVRYLVSSRNK
jgi:Transposase IS4